MLIICFKRPDGLLSCWVPVAQGLTIQAAAQPQKVILDCDLGGDIDDAFAPSPGID